MVTPGYSVSFIFSRSNVPGSTMLAMLKMACPCWIAVTRRTEKLPPSRVRSTW